MGNKIDSTAVNDLIEQASLKPLDSSSDTDGGLFARPRGTTGPNQTIMGVKPMSPGRAAHGTKTNLQAIPEAGSGGVSRPSRLTGIAPIAVPPVVSESDPWAIQSKAAVAEVAEVSDLDPWALEPTRDAKPGSTADRDVDLSDDEPTKPPPAQLAEDAPTRPPEVLVAPMSLPPLPPVSLKRTALGTPAPELVVRAGGRGTLPPPVRARTSTGTVTAPTIDVLAKTAAAPAIQMPTEDWRARQAPVLPKIAPTVALPAVARTAVVDKLPSPTTHVDLFEEDQPTEYFDREDEPVAPARNKLLIPMIAVGVAGALLGTILAIRGGGESQPAALAAKPAVTEPAITATAPVAAPGVTAPAAVPAVTAPVPQQVAAALAPPVEVAATPVLVDVKFDSEPDGATVMIVDRGTTTLVGTTPTMGSVDPSRSYDVVFTSAGHPTRVEHFDPKATHAVAIAYNRAPPMRVAAAPVVHQETHAAPVVHQQAAQPQKVDAKVDTTHKAADKKVAIAEPPKAKGGGVLMVSSKPPCQIFIDGKPTGLSTPQRALALPPGSHNVTLVNAQSKIKKTIAVEITAGKPTKLIQDLMKK